MANLSRNFSKGSPTDMKQLLKVNSLVSSIECHYRFDWVREMNVHIPLPISLLSQVILVNVMVLFSRSISRVSEHSLLQL